MTSAKALGCGVPVGAFMMTEKVGQNSLTSGDHGTTYGGNPLAAAAINVVLDLFEENHIIENVNQVGAYLTEKLDELVKKYDFITERRGVGLMQGLVFEKPVGEIITKALDKGLILINAGTNIIRFVPPLVIGKEHVDEMVEKLEARAARKSRVVLRYAWLGLFILVAIPLPGTGAWTGALVATLFDIRIGVALPAILAGVLIAGGVMTAVSCGVLSLF